jgi:hypothetical protein
MFIVAGFGIFAGTAGTAWMMPGERFVTFELRTIYACNY